MSSDAAGSEGRAIPRLATGWEAEAVGLNPEEGFLLSRIDGHTTWAMLREIGGLSPEEVDLALESWVNTGLVLLDTPQKAGAPPSRERKPEPPEVRKVEPAPLPEPDPSLDLDVALQLQIFEFEANLETRGYHEILGVERGAEARDIKRAYFGLSKRFHPDRYFRRNIGDCAQRLDRIFKRVVEAYELLSDPTTRAEIERSMTVAKSSGSSAETPETTEPGGYRAPTRMENLARLRRSFGGATERVLAERRFRAGKFYESAQVAASQKSWLEAAASVRLAIAFDPWNAEYKSGFAAIQAEVQAQRALELLDSGDSEVDPADALEALEEVICYRPADPGLQMRAAELAIEVGDLDAALEFAERICELAPEVARHHLIRAQVQRRKGDANGARRSIEKAARLAPGDPDIERERKRLKKTG